MPQTAEPWSLTSLHGKLFNIGARAVSHGRYVTFEMAEVRGAVGIVWGDSAAYCATAYGVSVRGSEITREVTDRGGAP